MEPREFAMLHQTLAWVQKPGFSFLARAQVKQCEVDYKDLVAFIWIRGGEKLAGWEDGPIGELKEC